MKILVDMNLSHKWAGFLLENGIEAVHWSSIGPHDSPDTDIFIYAQNNDFSILTNDLDFGFILANTQSIKPSVTQTRTGALGHGRIGDIVISTIKKFADDIEKGSLITIGQRKIRISLLPL